MFEWLSRDYEKVVRRLFKSGTGIIENENRQLPIPGVIQVASADVILPLSFPKIISARSDDAAHPRRAQQRRYQTVGLLDAVACVRDSL